MALYIRDPAVEELAHKAKRVLNSKSLTDAVRRALTEAIERQRSQLRPSEIIDQLRDEYKHILPESHASSWKEDKKFFDEMWGEED